MSAPLVHDRYERKAHDFGASTFACKRWLEIRKDRVTRAPDDWITSDDRGDAIHLFDRIMRDIQPREDSRMLYWC